MRVYSFTPAGGTEYVVPNITPEFELPQQYRSSVIEIPLSSGGISLYGDEAPRAMESFSLSYKIIAAAGTGSAPDAVIDTGIQAARKAFSARGWLRFLMGDGSYRRTWLTPQAMRYPRSYSMLRYCPVQVNGLLYPFLRSDALNGQSKTGTSFTITNAGDATVEDSLILTLSGHASPIASLTIAVGTWSLTWTGATALAVGQKLWINVGAFAIYRLDSGGSVIADEFPAIALSNTQTGLLGLLPGVNTFAVSALPAGSTWLIQWRDTWH